MLAACGGSDDSGPAATPIPQATSTPRSTPLPTLEEAPILRGDPERPVVMGFVVAEVNRDTREAQEALETALNDAVEDVAFEVQNYNNMGELLDAVCGSTAAVVWVDAFTYIAAERECAAQPLFAVRLSSQRQLPGMPDDVTVNLSAGIVFDVIYTTRLGTIGSLINLSNRPICRISSTDPISWIYFGMALRSAGVNPLDLPTVVDVDDYAAMLAAIDDRECDVGAIPRGTRESLADAADVNAENFNELTVTWPSIPHGVLIASPALGSELIAQVRTAVSELSTNDDLLLLAEAESIAVASSGSYTQFRRWLSEIGWEMER